MSILGKLLLVINLLATVGFGYLATQDWKGRQTITASGLRHLVLLNGLPLDGGLDQLPPRVSATSDGYDDFVSTKVPFRIEGPGGVPSESVSPELLYSYFATVGSGSNAGGGDSLATSTPVGSQLAEIRMVYARIKSELQKLDGSAAKSPLAGAWLRLQPESIEEREEVLALIAAKNGDELAHRLDLKFYGILPKMVESGPIADNLWKSLSARLEDLKAKRAAADEAAITADKEAQTADQVAADAEKEADAVEKDGTDPIQAVEKRKDASNKRLAALKKKSDSIQKTTEALNRARELERSSPRAPKDEGETRAHIAHLLVHLDQAAVWQKRCALVLGIKQYVKTVAEQILLFQQMTSRVERTIVDDQDRFSREYAHLLGLAIDQTQKVREITEIHAQTATQLQKAEEMVTRRQTDLAELKSQLAKVVVEVNDLLAKQSLVEEQMFAVQREIGMTLEEIYRQEAELAKIEKERYRSPK